MKLKELLKNKGIETDNDMVNEVIEYVEIDENADIDEILEHLDPSNLDYSGACHERIDSMVDMHCEDLRKWAVDNYEWVERAIENGLCADMSDYHKAIQCGQYEFYNDQFYSALSELTSEIENLEVD